jgi:hypothetical protein
LSATLYVLDADHGTKVGITIQPIEQRVADLARGSGFHPIVVRTWEFEKRERAYQIEQITHWRLRDTRTVGEWFHCHPLEACDAVEHSIRHGFPLAYFEQAAG